MPKYAPEPVKERLSKVEAVAAPLVTKATDTSTQLLKTVDTKVDQAVVNAHAMYQNNAAFVQQQLEKQKKFHAKNMENYRAAREQYLKKVEEAVNFVKSNGVTGTAKLAVDEKILNGTQPAVQMAYTKYQQVHDVVVASSSYKKLYDMSVSTVTQVQSSFIYRKAAENLYPYVARYADPAIGMISPSYQALMTHVAPRDVCQAAPATAAVQ
eukprot:jgi/Picre1/27515/NNA_000482.t1